MDGPSAWAEIDSILASIDPNRASWISQLESAAAGDRLLVGLEDWATLNRLDDGVLAAMLTHGFDSAGFINGVLSDSDLQELGVRSAIQRSRILVAVQDLPNSVLDVSESLSASDSIDWLLQRLCLGRQLIREFTAIAAALNANTVEDVASVTESDLRLRFGIRKLGHRRRIVCCLDNARALRRYRRHQQLPAELPNGVQHARQNSNLSAMSAASSNAAAAAPLPGASFSSSLSTDEDEEAAVAAGVANRRAAAAAPKTLLTEVLPRREMPPFPAGVSRSWVATGERASRQDAAADDEANSVGGPDEADKAAGSALPRSRSTDCLDDAAGQKRLAEFRPLISEAWPHHPDVLLRDSFSYSVSYLGFRPLVNHTDPAETAQVMLMFRCKSADILKLPRIRLTVCYRGVKFINPDNDMVITEHRITEIYFASQDNTRRANFAYVTKDSVNSVHYCHCFASHSPETAVLIIQTLSEACGLANQLIEFNQLRRRQQTRRRSSRKRNRRT